MFRLILVIKNGEFSFAFRVALRYIHTCVPWSYLCNDYPGLWLDWPWPRALCPGTDRQNSGRCVYVYVYFAEYVRAAQKAAIVIGEDRGQHKYQA